MSFLTNLFKFLSLKMTAQQPRPDSSSQGTARAADQLTPRTAQHNIKNNSNLTPDTVHNDKTSNTGSECSPWSGASSASTPFLGSGVRLCPDNNGLRNRLAPTSVPYVDRHSQKTITPSVQDGRVHAIRETHGTHGGVRLGRLGLLPQPSPCARMSGLNPHRNTTGGQFHPSPRCDHPLTNHTRSTLRTHGNIGDSRFASGDSTMFPSSAARQPETPIRGDPYSPGFGISFVSQDVSSSETDSGRSTGTLAESVAPPIYYQPMASLMATGSPYQPRPNMFGMLDPDHISSAFDGLASSMQQVGLHNTGSGINTAEAGPVARIQRHFSPHYQGDIFLPANQSEDIADDLNCSLFIVNLPPSLTTHELLAAIHKLGPLGRIFAIHINGPELQRNHPGCAAKVVFFKREVAHKFFTRCELNGFRVKGYNARVMWNRIKTSEKPHLANSDASRVLLIGGPPSIVNSSTLTDFFHTKLEYQVDSIITHVQGSLGSEDAVIEYRFGSFRCQAQAAKMALARELPHIRCFFGKDPLELEAYRPFEYLSFTENA